MPLRSCRNTSPVRRRIHNRYFLLGLLLREQKKNEEARKAFEKVHELNPDYGAATDQLIDLDIADKDFDGATRKAQQELSRAPERGRFALPRRQSPDRNAFVGSG